MDRPRKFSVDCREIENCSGKMVQRRTSSTIISAGDAATMNSFSAIVSGSVRCVRSRLARWSLLRILCRRRLRL